MQYAKSFIFIGFLLIQLLNVCFGGVSTWSQINGANMIASTRNGDLYVSSSDNIIYQLYQEKGTAVKFAGTGEAGFKDGDLFEATFSNPKGLFITDDSEIIVCDSGNNAIRRISRGKVDTLISGLPSAPISVTSWDSDIIIVGKYEYTTPVGLYITTESGDFYFADFGPSNDDCNFAVKLDVTTTATQVHGTTQFAAARVNQLPECNLQPEFAYVWYTFTGTGNQFSFSLCSASRYSFVELFIYSELSPNITTNTCKDLACIYTSYESESCSQVNLCTQPDMIYYVVASVEQGQFTITTQDLGVGTCGDCTCDGVECGLNDCLWRCESNECEAGTICIDSRCEKYAANSLCSGAIALPSSNYSFTANTLLSPYKSNPDQFGFECEYIENPGLWYTFVGTGDMVTLSTCSSFTDFDTIIHVYTSIVDCTELECLRSNDDGSCSTSSAASFVYFCSQPGVTYYYLVEGYGVGAFELTQSVNGPCVPGNYNNYYDYYSSYYYYYESSYWIETLTYYYYISISYVYW